MNPVDEFASIVVERHGRWNQTKQKQFAEWMKIYQHQYQFTFNIWFINQSMVLDMSTILLMTIIHLTVTKTKKMMMMKTSETLCRFPNIIPYFPCLIVYNNSVTCTFYIIKVKKHHKLHRTLKYYFSAKEIESSSSHLPKEPDIGRHHAVNFRLLDDSSTFAITSPYWWTEHDPSCFLRFSHYSRGYSPAITLSTWMVWK